MQEDRDQSRAALTRQIAERLDGEMRQLAVFGSSIEAALAQQPNWNEDQLKGFLTALLVTDDRIHGLTLAYEKNRSPTKQEYHCLYVYRSLKNRNVILTADLLPEKGYPLPRYLEWPWYTLPFESGRSQWTGPTFDGASGEEVWMVGYSVPMRQKGKKVGVVTVDLQANSFTAYRNWLAELSLGKKSYGFVVDGAETPDGNAKGQTGVFVSHPRLGAGDLKGEPPGRITDLPAIKPSLAHRILKGDKGQETGIDPFNGKRLTFLFHPVRSTGWSFVAVIEE